MQRTVGAETQDPLTTEGNGLLYERILLAPMAVMESCLMQNLESPMSEYLNAFTSFIFRVLGIFWMNFLYELRLH